MHGGGGCKQIWNVTSMFKSFAHHFFVSDFSKKHSSTLRLSERLIIVALNVFEIASKINVEIIYLSRKPRI